MAKPSWINLSTTSGIGNGTVTITASTHTGRVERSTGSTPVTFTTTTGGTPVTKTVSVTQAPTPGFISGSDKSITATATSASLSGTTNCDHFKIAILGSSTDWISLSSGTFNSKGYTPSEMTAGFTVLGEPGKAALYNWNLAFTVSPNTTITARSVDVELESDDLAEHSSERFTITQAAGAATISVSPTSLALNTAGTKTTTGADPKVTVTSNASWSVS